MDGFVSPRHSLRVSSAPPPPPTLVGQTHVMLAAGNTICFKQQLFIGFRHGHRSIGAMGSIRDEVYLITRITGRRFGGE
jgi:hypothetical protein